MTTTGSATSRPDGDDHGARRERRPRLLVMASTFPAAAQDGTPAFVRDLALQQAIEFETVVLTPRVASAAAREVVDGLTVERFAYFPRRWEDLADGAIIENLRSRRSRWLQVPCLFVAEIVALRRAIRRYRPDVLHIHWLVPQGVAALIGGRRVPWLVTTHGGDVYALNAGILRRLKAAVLRRSGAVTTMNEEMRSRLLALGASRDTTAVVPMGADVGSLRAAAQGITRVPGRLLFVGRLVEKKGVTFLLEALRGLGDGWSLQVVGDGPLRADLEELARRVSRPGQVEFLGTMGRESVARAYAAASVAVFPSVPAASGDQDGLPVALMEAMALGCSIVASRLPGIDSAIQHGVSGLLVPPGDVAELAGALRRLLVDDPLRARLGEGARRRADDFSVEAAGARYRAVLREVLARSVNPSVSAR